MITSESTGVVTKIEDDMVDMTMTSSEGEAWCASFPVDKFESLPEIGDELTTGLCKR